MVHFVKVEIADLFSSHILQPFNVLIGIAPQRSGLGVTSLDMLLIEVVVRYLLVNVATFDLIEHHLIGVYFIDCSVKGLLVGCVRALRCLKFQL